jgi:hypothetical protein
MEMPECRNAGKNISPASLVLPLVRLFSPASAFRHRRQSSTAGHGLFRQCPAMSNSISVTLPNRSSVQLFLLIF